MEPKYEIKELYKIVILNSYLIQLYNIEMKVTFKAAHVPDS